MVTLKEKLAKLDTDAEKRALVYKYALRTIKNKDSISKVAKIDPSKELKQSFKDLYAKAKTQRERDNLIYQYAIQQPKPKMVPVTVPVPSEPGATVTFNVMQDFFIIDGIRVSPSPPIAQRIAQHFGMSLPTAKMADLVYRNSNKISARPLSGTGVEIDGKKYSPQDVISNLIGDSRATIAYSDRVSSDIANQKNMDPTKPIDGFAKSIVQPESGKENRAAYYGIWTNTGENSKPAQGGIGTTPHGLTQQEYIAWLRGVDNNNVVYKKPDGTIVNTTLDNALNNSKLSPALTVSTRNGPRSYLIEQDGPPPGYKPADLNSSIRPEAEAAAKSLLNRPLGSEIPVTLSNGITYVARKEKHSNKPEGISLYEPKNPANLKPGTTSPTTTEVAQNTPVTPQRKSMMDKITDFISNLSQGLS